MMVARHHDCGIAALFWNKYANLTISMKYALNISQTQFQYIMVSLCTCIQWWRSGLWQRYIHIKHTSFHLPKHPSAVPGSGSTYREIEYMIRPFSETVHAWNCYHSGNPRWRRSEMFAFPPHEAGCLRSAWLVSRRAMNIARNNFKSFLSSFVLYHDIDSKMID